MCDLKKSGSRRYAEDVTTEILCLLVKWEDGTKTRWFPGQPIPPRIADAIADPKMIWVAHNAGFEKDIWREQQVPMFGWPDIPNSRWHCTQAMCAMRVIPQDLEMALKVMRIPLAKDMAGNKITLGLSKIDKKTGMLPARTPELLERVATYCEGDVDGQAALHRRLGWMPGPERDVWLLNQRMNERGIRLDMALVRKMREIVDKATPPLAAEFAGLTGGLTFTQIQKVKGWVNDRGVHTESLDKEHLAELIGDMEDPEFDPDDWTPEATGMDPAVHRALTIRRLVGSASVKKLDAMEASVCADGRVRRTLQYHGTGPGRSAGRLLQPHNFPRGSNAMLSMDVDVKVAALMTGDPEWVEMTLGVGPVEAVVSALRHCVIPNPGRVFLSGDYSGIQARTVLAVAGQHDKARLMSEGLDVYIDMSFNIFPSLRFDLTDKALVKAFKHEHVMERTLGKNSVLGLGFQMGAPKFRNKYAKEQTLEFVQGVVDAYRQEWAPEVPKVWRVLQDAALTAVKTRRPVDTEYGVTYAIEDEWLTCRLPSTRKLWYFNPQLVRRLMPWSTPEEPDVRLAWTYQARKMGQWKTIDAFGGQLTENVVMGIERDLMTHAMLKLERNGFPVVLEVHDEILAEPLKPDADEAAFQQIMTDVPQWCRDIQIPVAVEGWSGDRYRK